MVKTPAWGSMSVSDRGQNQTQSVRLEALNTMTPSALPFLKRLGIRTYLFTSWVVFATGSQRGNAVL